MGMRGEAVIFFPEYYTPSRIHMEYGIYNYIMRSASECQIAGRNPLGPRDAWTVSLTSSVPSLWPSPTS